MDEINIGGGNFQKENNKAFVKEEIGIYKIVASSYKSICIWVAQKESFAAEKKFMLVLGSNTTS